ncbi:hypothetical protein VA7868_02420 [Vibrio aerogenes CECT 7868]|uniref:Gamma-glutamylcyclotransferase AIG2-like domain-containing protein n=1 Tax=Vibrio aerogenes CECT 7868 TaxID=1216006 RepID=A0A1M5Z7Y2_9VIBR|nr:gamma-glutamylcyclotransferase family protein [Vibrio aerogenes]SHI20345.1 hypothetical protein VA7868_02420 [Vibrio aerogenes CECT 7868]
MSVYIFGYGSLMNSSSRRLTGQTGQAIPAVVSGLIRHWGKVDDSYFASPLVSEPGAGLVNGVLLEIMDEALEEFDKREAGYQRIPLLAEQFEAPLDLTTEDDIWVYIKSQPLPPCENVPVLQTYIDTVLSGCLEISEDFARFFIRHTRGWQSPVDNDRQQPRYKNYAGIPEHHIELIDELLAVHA